jgi:hypothetical protein
MHTCAICKVLCDGSLSGRECELCGGYRTSRRVLQGGGVSAWAIFEMGSSSHGEEIFLVIGVLQACRLTRKYLRDVSWTTRSVRKLRELAAS